MTQPIRPAREVTLERACSQVSTAHGETLPGTASLVRRWLLVEQPGAWGQEALLQSDLPIEVARELRRRTDALGMRLLLIRRPGRDRGATSRTAFVIHSGPGRAWQRRVCFSDCSDLLDLDLAALLRGEAGEPVTEPIYAVCTNGKHDLCCAVAGLPLARTLSRLGEVWECSHVGGDRFAANLVCFPEGLYYGRVTPWAGREILLAHGRRELVLEHFRGRSCLPFGAQAAEAFVRRERTLTGLDDVAVGAASSAGPSRDRYLITVAGEPLPLGVDVTATPSAHARRLTCRGAATAPPSYHAVWAIDQEPEHPHA